MHRKWLIAGGVALLVTGLGSGALIAFTVLMARQKAVWQDFGMKMPAWQMVAFDLADFCMTFLPVLILLLLGLGIGLGLVIAKVGYRERKSPTPQ